MGVNLFFVVPVFASGKCFGNIALVKNSSYQLFGFALIEQVTASQYGTGKKEFFMKQELTVLVIVAALSLMTKGLAASDSTGMNTSKDMSSGDASFVREASSSGEAEVEFGRLLTEKAQSSDLKTYGQRLIDDHTQANEKLSRIASQKGLQVSTEPTMGERNELEKLSKLSGKDFDEAARKYAIRDHEKDIRKFTDATSALQDPELRQYAQQTLPVLQDHLRRAQELKLGS